MATATANDIKILARVKPMAGNPKFSCVKSNDNKLIVSKEQKGYCDDYTMDHTYTLDRVFDQHTKTEEVYNTLNIDILRNLIRRKKNVTLYVYGQTGSGKTHTILGNEKEHGFLYLILTDLLEIKFNVNVTMVEIYNNKCYDILNNRAPVVQREDMANNFQFRSLAKKKIETEKCISQLREIVSLNRKTGESSENSVSSRSHLQVTLDIQGRQFRLLDLAGCERAKRSICASKSEFKENGEINQSLFALKECIRALVDGKSHIPYRRCELTKMLRQSFEHGCKTYILATVPQERSNSITTIDVLNYVIEMKNIKKTQKRNASKPNLHEKDGRNEKGEKERGAEKELPELQLDIPFPPPTGEECSMLGSPNFRHVFANKKSLQKLILKEKDLLDKMIEKKTTNTLLSEYLEVIESKKRILIKQCGSFVVNPIPPSSERPDNQITNPSPRITNENIVLKVSSSHD